VLRAAALLASLSLVLALPAAASDSAAAKSVTIRVIATPVTRAFDDVAPKTHATTGQYTKGDTLSGTSILRNAVQQLGLAKGARVGTSRFEIIALSSQRAMWDGFALLPGGSVHAHGVVKIEANPKVPIVGGTGLYKGATGVVEGQLLANSVHLDILRMRVP
jgi:hypothetical protein